MLINITFTIGILVAVNFLLLKLSCNKTPKKGKTNKAAIILRPDTETEPLAPTGS